MNLTGPNPDTRLQQAIRDIVQQANVGCIIETGTYHGDSTAWIRQAFPDYSQVQVYTVEADSEAASVANRNLETLGINCDFGSSDDWLTRFLMPLCWDVNRVKKTAFCLLDAHYFTHWPLLNELKVINTARLGYKVTALIDDFFVPGREQFAGCYGGLRGDDSKGREQELIRCGYNEPFAAELDKFPALIYPRYPEPNIGYCIASDFQFVLGPEFEVVR